MDRVKMPIELQRPARAAACQPDDHGRGGSMSPLGPFDGEPVLSQNLGQAIGHLARLTGWAWNCDQPPGRLDQALTMNCFFEIDWHGSLGVINLSMNRDVLRR
jgi:hypothetical protein